MPSTASQIICVLGQSTHSLPRDSQLIVHSTFASQLIPTRSTGTAIGWSTFTDEQWSSLADGGWSNLYDTGSTAIRQFRSVASQITSENQQ